MKPSTQTLAGRLRGAEEFMTETAPPHGRRQPLCAANTGARASGQRAVRRPRTYAALQPSGSTSSTRRQPPLVCRPSTKGAGAPLYLYLDGARASTPSSSTPSWAPLPTPLSSIFSDSSWQRGGERRARLAQQYADQVPRRVSALRATPVCGSRPGAPAWSRLNWSASGRMALRTLVEARGAGDVAGVHQRTTLDPVRLGPTPWPRAPHLPDSLDERALAADPGGGTAPQPGPTRRSL